jgi:hypothetical protein
MPTACPWTARVWHEYRADNLSRTDRDILLTLRSFRGTGGLCIPSHAALADRAKTSVSTVQRTLRQADHLGLVHWAERRIKAGWRWLRTSNRYRFTLPETPVAAGMRLRRPRPQPRPDLTTGQDERGTKFKFRKEALKAMLAEAMSYPVDLLAKRCRDFEVKRLWERRA